MAHRVHHTFHSQLDANRMCSALSGTTRAHLRNISIYNRLRAESQAPHDVDDLRQQDSRLDATYRRHLANPSLCNGRTKCY